MKKVKLFLVILILAMFGAVTLVKAADSVKISGTLNIKHRLGMVVNHTGKSGKELPNPIDSKLAYDIHKNEVIEIRVDDPNPFIYNYKFKGIQKTQTEDYTAIEKFLEAIEPFFKEVDKTKNINNKIKDIQAQIKKFSMPTNQAVRIEIDNMEIEIKRLVALEKFYKELGLDENFFNGLSSNIKQLVGNAKKIPGYILDTTIESEMPRIAEDIKTWNCDLRKNFDDAYKIINNAQMKFLSESDELKKNAIKENIEDDFFLTLTMLSFAQDQKANIMELLDNVESFNNTFKKMNSPDPGIILGTITYSEKEKITATVEISFTNTEFEKKVNTKLKTGSFDFIFAPHITFKYQFGLSQILSTFKNVDENGKEKNFQLQVPTLTIIPHQWDDWKVKPNFQLGFTVKDDLKHLIFGPGIKLFDSFYVGGGAHLRWGKDSLLRLGGYLNLSFTPLKLN